MANPQIQGTPTQKADTHQHRHPNRIAHNLEGNQLMTINDQTGPIPWLLSRIEAVENAPTSPETLALILDLHNRVTALEGERK